ncbi:unnamed protein product [Adineta ricciae]|uniref:Apple domain-containing protein n=1 Tax=Adineta ricciae TaxID=249248 RepID=A0A814L8Z6_ADIRI|nr:unnamed protein product [Adineta ricciae]
MYFFLAYLFIPSINAIVSVQIHRLAQYKPNSSCALLANVTLSSSVSIQSCIWQCVEELKCQTAVYSYDNNICWMYGESCESGSIESSGSNRSSVICYRKNPNSNMHCPSAPINNNSTTTVTLIIIQASNIDIINASAQYGCPTSINVTAKDQATVGNLCATDQLNIDASGVAHVSINTSICARIMYIFVGSGSPNIDNICATQSLIIQSSSASTIVYNSLATCPSNASVTVSNSAKVVNVCSTDQLNIDASGAASISINNSVCPRVAAVNLQSSAVAHGICATDLINANTSSGSTLTMIRSNSALLCPLLANVHASTGSRNYVCGTQVINVIADNGASVYCYGVLNYMQVLSGALVFAW